MSGKRLEVKVGEQKGFSLKFLQKHIQKIIKQKTDEFADDPGVLESLNNLQKRLDKALNSFQHILDIVLPRSSMTEDDKNREERQILVKKAVEDIQASIHFYGRQESFMTIEVNSENFLSVARQIFHLEPNILDDRFLEVSLILLSTIRRWGLGNDQYSYSKIDPKFEESDLMHIVKMAFILNDGFQYFGISNDDEVKVLLTIFLHDLSEVVVGDYSNGELDPTSKASQIYRDIFKAIEEQVAHLIPIIRLKRYQHIRGRFRDYELRNKQTSSDTHLDHLVKLIDKLDSFFTVAAVDVVSKQTENFYNENHYSTDTNLSASNFWKAFEVYAKNVLDGGNPSVLEPGRVHYLKNILNWVLSFIRKQRNLQTGRIQTDHLSVLYDVDLEEIIQNSFDPQEYPTLQYVLFKH